mmetsp:Transcript_3909/g.13841  ORF Transcript_3909/g.13841 Transcript_3909/m.13841 type:complete len:205 (-) Transcript_3909:618-1232(-)
MEHRTRAPTRIEAAPSAPAARTARGRATATRAAAYLRRLNGFIRESVTLERAEEPLASGEFAAATLYITSSRSFPCGLCGKRPRSSLSPVFAFFTNTSQGVSPIAPPCQAHSTDPSILVNMPVTSKGRYEYKMGAVRVSAWQFSARTVQVALSRWCVSHMRIILLTAVRCPSLALAIMTSSTARASPSTETNCSANALSSSIWA